MSFVRLWCEPRHAWARGFLLSSNATEALVPVDSTQFTDSDEWEVFVQHLEFPDRKKSIHPWPTFRYSVVPLTLSAARELIASDVRRLKLKRYEQ
jgi:hypothetical protein